ncbi:MAG TPA: putative toxin-antitoxin system toxin component, PIN family [Anaeromyxobacteraceae bacterium]|nr:putative toxin-antitoxin system toxin component, PIN family [Anaeromyxobacteraceae bacterium]
MRVRAVLDTNVLVSAVLSPQGTPAAVVRAAGEAYTLVSTPDIVAEWLRVVAYDRVVRRLRRMGREEEARATVARLARIADLVPSARLPMVRVITADPSDDLFLATALAGGAHVLVSGDRRHVLPLGEFAGIRIIDAATFARELGLPGFPPSSGAVHEVVAPWGDGVAALEREAQRWARERARRELLEFLRSRSADDPSEDEAMALALEAQRWARARARRARARIAPWS